MTKMIYTNTITGEQTEVNVTERVPFFAYATMSEQIVNAVVGEKYLPYMYDIALMKGLAALYTDLPEDIGTDEIEVLMDDTDFTDRLFEIVDKRQVVRLNDWVKAMIDQKLAERNDTSKLLAAFMAMLFSTNTEEATTEEEPVAEEAAEEAKE